MHNTETSAARRLMSLPLEIKADGTTGSFEGYGAIFGNKDRDGDIVARGAFTESLKAGMPALLWQHDQKAPIGRFDAVREDDKGLFVKGKLVMQGQGLEAYELLKMGALNGLSIGFVTKEASRDPATNTRTISKADLMEISLVTFPANELARVSNVKAALSTSEETSMFETPISDARSFERMLRDNGFSRSRAKAITAKGFKAVDLGTDESTEIAELVRELKTRRMLLEEKSRKNCGPGCTDCEPCQKSWKNPPECQELTLNVTGLNKRRWKAWRRVEQTTQVYQSAVREYAASQSREFRADLLGTLVSIATASAGVMGLVSALNSVFNLIHKYQNYNGELMRDFRAKLRSEIRELEWAHREAKNADEDFRTVVAKMKEKGCSLHSSYFNRV